jgi:hypothetical protein
MSLAVKFWALERAYGFGVGLGMGRNEADIRSPSLPLDIGEFVSSTHSPLIHLLSHMSRVFPYSVLS